MKEGGDELKNFFDFLKKNLQSNEYPSKNRKIPPHFLLGFLVIGIIFIVGSNFFSKQETNVESTPTFSQTNNDTEAVETFGKVKETQILDDYKDKYETELENILNEMAGVKNVQVVVTLGSSEKKIYEKNQTSHNQQTTEEDKQGGTRQVDDESIEEQVVIINKDGNEIPVVVQTEPPVVKGILIVANGMENLKIKERVIEAVTRVLDVPRHKVSVQPKK